jgi:hypothetical protein
MVSAAYAGFPCTFLSETFTLGHNGSGTYINVCEYIITTEEIRNSCCQTEGDEVSDLDNETSTASPSTTDEYPELSNFLPCTICHDGNFSVNRQAKMLRAFGISLFVV